MQPNGNMPGAGRSVAGAPVSNVNAKPAPASTPVPKPVEPAFGNGGSVVEGKGGKKTGWILAVVFLLIVAAGGIGFGVWAWMDGNAQKDRLNQQISDLKKQNNELLDKIAEYESKIEEELEIEEDSEDFYIEEWGLNIKMPDSISDIEYEKGDGYSDVCDSGIKIKSLIKDGKKVDAGGLEGVAFIQRCTEIFPYGTLVFEDDAFKYYYEFPNGLSAEDSQEVQDVVDDLKNILNNKENYSKI